MYTKEIEYKGYTIKVYTDDDPMNPREWDNLGTMVCWHNRYNLGDEKNPFSDPDEFAEFVQQEQPVYLPLYLYDHSGITMKTSSFHDMFDSGQVGWIYVTREKIQEEYGYKRLTAKRVQQIESYLRNEVKTYDDYLTGSVYGYHVEDEEGEDIDSCWGFFGDDHKESGLLEQAQSMVDYELEHKVAA